MSAYASKHYPTGHGIPDQNISTAVVSTAPPSSEVSGRHPLAYPVPTPKGPINIPMAWATVLVHFDQFYTRIKCLDSHELYAKFEAVASVLIYTISSSNHDEGERAVAKTAKLTYLGWLCPLLLRITRVLCDTEDRKELVTAVSMGYRLAHAAAFERAPPRVSVRLLSEVDTLEVGTCMKHHSRSSFYLRSL